MNLYDLLLTELEQIDAESIVGDSELLKAQRDKMLLAIRGWLQHEADTVHGSQGCGHYQRLVRMLEALIEEASA